MVDLAAISASLRNCPCGRKHTFDVQAVEIRPGMTGELGNVLRANGFVPRLHMVSDANTDSACPGLRESLRAAGFVLSETRFDNLTLSDVPAMERVKADISQDHALGVLSVGTGSLNDICRRSAYELDIPFAIFATAPSMDGFASCIAPITENGFKKTFPAKAPLVIAADSDVLAASPDVLKAAGLGDLLGKYTALADWRISALLTGEYYCPRVAQMTADAVDAAVRLASADDKGVAYSQALMEALVMSGLAMQLCGCSRPASGAEHHLAHFWEMKFEVMGLPPVYHGRKVGVSAGMMADLYRELADLDHVVERRRVFDEADVSSVYGQLWEGARGENIPDPLEAVPDGAITANWGQIREVLSTIPSGKTVRSLLSACGGAALPSECGISSELARQAFRYGKYTRARLTMLRLLDMLDLEPIFHPEGEII